MKKIYILLTVFAAAILAGGCAKEQAVPQIQEGTSITASLSPVKTAINGVKVTWTAGDAINVNGAVSGALAEDAVTAVFTFRTVIENPFKALYPTSIYKDEQTITLPASWSIDNFKTPLGGYAATGKEVTFSALTAFVKISLTGEETTTVKNITLTGKNGEQLAGDFTIDFQTLALTGASQADADKTLKVNVAKALSSEPLIVYIPVPAGEYTAGYTVDITDAEGKIMRQEVLARTIKAGELREMPALVFEPNVEEPQETLGGIPNAAEFKAFAAAVNEGRSIARWLNQAGEVELQADIDLEGAEWAPIGSATVTTGNVIDETNGYAFTGVFDGKDHKVDNFNVTVPASAANYAAGLFGTIKGATVKNLVIGDKVVITNNGNTGFVTIGAAVGHAYESTIDKVDSYAGINSAAGKNSVRLVIGGAVGTLFASETASTTVTNVKGHASFNVTNSVNTNNGGSGFIVGGVIGWTDGKTLDTPVIIKDCENFSDIDAQATRLAGVVGTMNTCTKAEGLVNRGKITCSDVTASNSRPSGIVSAMGKFNILKGCINYGDVQFTVSGDKSHGYAAGIVGQTNCDQTYVTEIDGCENYGAVQTDMYFGNKYMGIICADFNTKKVTVKNCVLGGKIGPFTPTDTDPVVDITADNFEKYYSMEAESRVKNVHFENNSAATK